MANRWMIKPLRAICDQRGRLMELRRTDWEDFEYPAKQVYMTTAYPGVTKAWHLHRKQTDFMVIVSGMMMVGLYDEEADVSEVVYAGEHNPVLIKILPEVWHGFKNIGTSEAIVINSPDQLYDYENPDEFRKPWNFIPGFWETKNG